MPPMKVSIWYTWDKIFWSKILLDFPSSWIDWILSNSLILQKQWDRIICAQGKWQTTSRIWVLWGNRLKKRKILKWIDNIKAKKQSQKQFSKNPNGTSVAAWLVELNVKKLVQVSSVVKFLLTSTGQGFHFQFTDLADTAELRVRQWGPKKEN